MLKIEYIHKELLKSDFISKIVGLKRIKQEPVKT